MGRKKSQEGSQLRQGEDEEVVFYVNDGRLLPPIVSQTKPLQILLDQNP